MAKPQLQGPRAGRIQRRLMVWGLSLLSLALVINTFAGSFYTRQRMRESTARRQAAVALFTARHMQSFLSREIKRLQDGGAAMMMFPFGGKEQRGLAQLILENGQFIEEVTILDRAGAVVLRLLANEDQPAAPSSAYQYSPEFRAAAAGTSYIEATPDALSSRPAWVTMALPLRAATGAVSGALIARARLDFLRQAIGDVKFSHRGNAYVIDDTGSIIIHSDPAFALVKRDLSALPKARQFLAGQSADLAPAEEVVGIAGTTVVSTYAHIADLRWGIILEEPLDVVIAESQDLLVYAVVLLAAGLFLGAVIIVWLSRRITRPIQELRHSVQVIRQGDLAHRADVKTSDEIEELAREFNYMTAELEQSRATLEQRVEQRTQEISALYEITAMVSQTLDTEAVLDAVIKKITALFGFDTTRVYLYDSDTDLYSLSGCFEVNPEPWIDIASFKRGQSIVGKVVETGQPKIFEDIANNAAYFQLSENGTSAIAGMGFLAVFPIKTKHSCYGALVFSGKSNRSLKDEEIRLLSSMAEQIGVAVENSSLYQQARSKSAHLMVLNEVAAAVSRSLDLETVLREALEKVVDILKFDASWVYMMDAQGQKLRLEAYKGLSSKTADMLAAQSRGSSISRTVISSGRRVEVADEPEREHYRSAVSVRAQPHGRRGSIAVPIKTRDRVIGVLYAVSWQTRRYTADDLALIESLAQEIGVAVEHAKLFSEIKKQSTELEKINQELRAATQAKSEFIAAMSHELRTPLNIMIGNADITHDGIFGEINDDQKVAMRKIARNGHVLLRMINDLLKLSRLEAKRLALEPTQVDIAEIMQHARDQVAQLNREGHLEMGWHVEEELPRIFTDAMKLEEILQNLIGNAFKFTAAGRIDVSVRNVPGRQAVEFSVADTGIGIDTDNLDRVFEKFEQIKTPGKSKNDGVGLGLSIVKKYLELMQGGIRVKSARGKGATFVFWLPYRLSLSAADGAPQAQALTSQARNS
jgi:signal transduction histidine kinase